ncbi:VWA domain-containing protein [Lentilitoribacter sp. Alg239-R112]|uniref:vWA domain-containing protein n=1 Tax=Lentilitoribacter sp. Alg239-R112 TaxID=2305987 RepID=UPI0013A6E86A|nr:VWA domain-containing protein [Lentilitoribacter sp. Alg239-R112]
MNRLLKTSIIGGIALLSSAGFATSQQIEQANEVMFILDGSNSMWGQIKGTAKISIAKDVMTDLITNLDPDINMGLMAYGHRRKNDCKDIEVLALPGPVNRQQMIEHVQNITPRGKTPLTQALFLGAFSVEYFSGKSSVVLVSDGLETCNADPCAQARSLETVNPGFDVHVIGFDVTKEESASLQCIADETGGKFFRANNANELKDALAQTLAAVQSEAVEAAPAKPLETSYLYAKLCETCERLDPLEVRWNVSKNGQQHYQGIGAASSSKAIFEQGKYQVGARLGTSVATASGEIEFGADGEQIGELNLNAGSANITAFATDDKVTPQEVFFRFFPIVDSKVQDQLTEASGNDRITWLPAGMYKITAQINKIEASAEIEIVAGQETPFEFDLRVGYIRPDVVLFEGGEINRGMYYRLLDAETGNELAGVTGRGDEPIPAKPGKYDLRVQYSSPNFIGSANIKFPVEIKAGETISGPYVMNVGRFEYNMSSASGASIGGVWLDRISEDGKSTREIGFSRNAKYPGVAPEGTYKFRVRVGDKFLTTGPIEIVAGEVRELNIEFP